MKNKKKAFTLTELLVVVIVLGTLAAVAVPKFSRVLETRRTGEAEEMLSAVRTEQEKRCSLGQNYTGDFSKMPTVAYAKSGESQGKTSNYTYTLTSTGIEASRGGKDYVLKIPSYKTGEICCEGSGCDALNKSYPACSSLSLPAADECAASDVVVPEDPCDSNPNSCACSAYAASHRCECDADYASANACECNPSTATCCGEGEEWDAASGSCKPTDECVDEYGPATVISSGTDTCDGNGTDKYTCDGHFSGTCTDVYTRTFTTGGLFSSEKDPFLMFKNSILLAGLDTEERCIGYGEHARWDNELEICMCPDGPCQGGSGSGGGDLEIGGEIGGGIGGEVVDGKTTYKRQVTCCGDGQAVEDDCTVNPNQEKCCKFPNVWCVDECVSYRESNTTKKCCKPPHVWNGQFCVMVSDPCATDPNSCSCPTYAEEHKCECQPSTANCCTSAQIKGGMVYSAVTKKCSCPSGTQWNSSTQKCESAKYNCFTGYNSRTVNNPSYVARPGQLMSWRPVYANSLMDCGGPKGTVTYQKGQAANCVPGQNYLYNMTYAYAASSSSGSDNTYVSGYHYTCLRCQAVSDLSQCGNFTVPPPSGQPSTGGSGNIGGDFELKPNPGDGFIEFN